MSQGNAHQVSDSTVLPNRWQGSREEWRHNPLFKGDKPRMQICLVGDFSENLDEGYKNTSHHLANNLATRNEVIRLNVKHIGSIHFWRSVAAIAPQVIHAITQPTHGSLLCTRLIQQIHPNARTVISALKADKYFIGGTTNPWQRILFRVARPDLVLVQSPAEEALFKQLGCTVCQLPNGVDLDLFKPATVERKRQLRTRYNLDPDRPVVLHVGHLEPDRNLTALEELPREGIQVLIAGSLQKGMRPDLIAHLEGAGFHVLKGYQPHVEELYMLSDCYVFPLPPGNSLTMPLSVLEAMACNLPVVTTRFKGLEHAFREGQGLSFIDDTGRILSHVQAALASNATVTTRQMVQNQSWESVATRLEKHYGSLVKQWS